MTVGSSSNITTAESQWRHIDEKRPIHADFNPDSPSICVPAFHPVNRTIWNVGSRLLVGSLGTDSSDRPVMVDLGASLSRVGTAPVDTSISQDSGRKAVITSMDTVADSLDRNSLLVGFSTGQVQVMAPPVDGGEHSIVSHYNIDRSLNSTRCVLVSWVPCSHGSEFLSVHANGQILRHHRITGNSSDKELLNRSEKQSPSTEVAFLSHGRVTAAALSPDGVHLAVATTDRGMMYIVDVSTGHVVGGFRSFFGSFCCCTWSPDGKYIAAGGEDDLIAIYKIGSNHVLAHCQGHTSWPTCCTFEYCSDMRLRLLSVGQDCRLCIWEINLEKEAEVPTQQQYFVTTVNNSDMNRITPVFCEKVHIDPLSSVALVSDAYLVICAYDGTFKAYATE